MNIDQIRKALTGDGETVWINPYAVDISPEEFRNDCLSEDPILGLVKCRDCKCYVRKEHAIEQPEDYVCLACEEIYNSN